MIKHPFTPPPRGAIGEEGDNFWVNQLGGIAACDGLVVASMNKLGMLLFIDMRSGKVVRQ